MNNLNKKYFGKIYFPESPNDIIEGVWLYYDDKAIVLEVPRPLEKHEKRQIICGTFIGLDNITFVNTYTGGWSQGSGGSYYKIHASYMILNKNFDLFSDLNLRKVKVLSPALLNWIQEPIFISKNRLVDNSFDIKVPPAHKALSIKHQDINIEIEIVHELNDDNNIFRIEEKCFLNIESIKEFHITTVFELFKKLKKFILFITNKNPEFEDCFLLTTNKDDRFLELITRRNDLIDSSFAENLSFSYHDFKSSLNEIFYNWINQEKIEEIIDLIQENERRKDISFQRYFLNMCVAIDSYSGNFNKVSENNKIDQRLKERDEITQLLSDNDRLKNTFLSKTSHWEYSTYREKLKYYKPVFKEIIGNTFTLKVNDFINKVYETRNSLAHDGTYKIDFIELLLFGKVLEYTLKIEILNLLEFKPKDADKLIEQARKSISLLARINQYNKSN